MKTTKKGFTLIELIVVIAIIGVLAAILVPTMLGYVKKSKISSANSSASSVYKAINSALTELDEEGVDVGGLWLLTWNGDTWSAADTSPTVLTDMSTDKEALGYTLGAASGKKQFDNKVSNFFNDISKIKNGEAAIKGGSCVAIVISSDKTYTGTYPGGIVTTDSYESYSFGDAKTQTGIKNGMQAALAVASGDVKAADVNKANTSNKKKLEYDNTKKPATGNADYLALWTAAGNKTTHAKSTTNNNG